MSEKYIGILEIESSDNECSDSDNEMPYAHVPSPVDYKTERMYILTSLSYLLNKVKALTEDVEEALARRR